MRSSLLRWSLVLPLLAACSSSSPAGTATTSSALSGPLELRVSNADDDDVAVLPPADTVAHVVVTLSRIDARFEDGRPDDEADVWTTVSSALTTVDLLALQGGTFGALGIVELPAGSLEALRLFLSPTGPNYVTTADGLQHPLVFPFDCEAGIRIVGDFEVEGCASGHVTIAFAGRKSLDVDTGSGLWMLRPVIHLREVVAAGVCPGNDDGLEQGDDGRGGRGYRK